MDKTTYTKIYNDFNQYKSDLFYKLGIDFRPGKSILDVGAGDCTDTKIFRDVFGLEVLATDIYKSQNVDDWGIPFKLLSVYEIGKLEKKFDYVFLHDILHHVDEDHQSRDNHVKALAALKQVVKPKGAIVLVEGNRYNPLFLPHMVIMRGHEHFKQEYFKTLVKSVFPAAKFYSFEAHYYPYSRLSLWFFKIYERLMESIAPAAFLSYNVAVINNNEE
uniref:Class I SAM-dependent methyltransferase n=1 Tax=candidate division WWE3 bacterium TaxID=2053526 RepID=A0A7C4XTK2_UNCKA